MYSAEQTHAKPTDGYSRSRTENNALEEAQATEKEKKRNVFQMILKWELNEKRTYLSCDGPSRPVWCQDC